MTTASEKVRLSVDLLVPFINTLVNLFSSPNLEKKDLKKELIKLKINEISEDDWQIESTSIISAFKVYLLYSGRRSFVIKVDGLSDYKGFSFLETNKGIVIHDNAATNPMPLAKNLKEQFLKNYRRPFLVTKTFLNFLEGR